MTDTAIPEPQEAPVTPAVAPVEPATPPATVTASTPKAVKRRKRNAALGALRHARRGPRRDFPLGTVRRLARKGGMLRVERAALEAIKDTLTAVIQSLTTTAATLTAYRQHKIVTAADLRYVYQEHMNRKFYS